MKKAALRSLVAFALARCAQRASNDHRFAAVTRRRPRRDLSRQGACAMKRIALLVFFLALIAGATHAQQIVSLNVNVISGVTDFIAALLVLAVSVLRV